VDFPQFQVPHLGHGMIIGTNAVVHVILSHGIAIGGVFFITLTELIGFWRKDARWDKFAYYAVVPAAVIISSFSAITGVGIWFTIGTLAPRGAAEMLRLFFWPWFLEWIDFVSEAIIILVYYLLWHKMITRRAKIMHISLGFAYVITGFVSAVLITGILGFQLTPGQWPWHQNFWTAFFNPTLWPQIFVRFFGGIAVGACIISAYLFLWHELENKEAIRRFRHSVLKVYGWGLAISTFLTTGVFLWYMSNIPETFKVNAKFSILTSHFSQTPWVLPLAIIVLLILILLLALVNILGWQTLTKIVVIPAMLASFAFVAGYERMREFIRGPYIMSSYLYASEWTPDETAMFKDNGMHSRLYWPVMTYSMLTPEQEAHEYFGHNCNTCHTIGGVNDIRYRVRNRSIDGISAILDHTNEMVPWMPPFAGNSNERVVLANYLHSLSLQSDVKEPAWSPAPQKELSNE